jgi:hypothetical protein
VRAFRPASANLSEHQQVWPENQREATHKSLADAVAAVRRR